MRVIYVDDEQPALDNFRLTAAGINEIHSLELFQDGEAALEWVKGHVVDVAFLDMEMPGLNGLSLAGRLREVIPNIRVVFVTAYSQYALDAWSVDALGYILKPYTAAEVHKELKKCVYNLLPSQRVVIQTIPTLSVTVNGKPLQFTREKTRELFALLVDRGEGGLAASEGIACLWPDRPDDNNTKSLFRVTYKRMADVLDAAGAGDIIETKADRRYLRVEQVDCDLYRILAGDARTAKKYAGQYMEEYSWAEERNGQLYRMLLNGDF